MALIITATVTGVAVSASLLVGVVIGWTAHRDRFPSTQETDERPETWRAS